MRKICVINQKGGVGKTTTTVNLGVGLAKRGKKVLIVDLDPQGSIHTCLGVESQKDLYELLVEGANIKECITNALPNLDVIKSRETLTKAELILFGEPSRETVLRRKLSGLTMYDYIILDCPPSLGLLNQNAVLYADEAIIPASTDVLGLEGLRNIVSAISKINTVFGHNLRVSKVVPTMHDVRNKICVEILDTIHKEFPGLVTEPIRINSKFKEAPRAKQSIYDYDPKSRGVEDYEALVTMVLVDEQKNGRATMEYVQVKPITN